MRQGGGFFSGGFLRLADEEKADQQTEECARNREAVNAGNEARKKKKRVAMAFNDASNNKKARCKCI